MIIIPKGIYGITDSKSGKDKNIFQYVEEMLQGGIKVIQYREKYKPMGEKYQETLKLKKLIDKYNGIFIINDHVDLALLVDAHGVHLGQNDLPISQVRKLLGKNKIIGISTHSLEEGLKAQEDGADYIGVGPLFSTKTKDDVMDPIGLSYLEDALKKITIPKVAIGGIKEKHLELLKNLGVENLCLVSDIVGAPNTLEKVQNLIKIFNQ